MIYLSGTVLKPFPNRDWLGVMVTPRMGNVIPDCWWAADNGCFSSPGSFDWDEYERFLRRSMNAKCLFVTAPDVPFSMDGTLQRFEFYRDRLRNLGAPIALVTQDGMGVEDVPWSDLSAIFVGGSTEWKLGHESTAIMTTARERGLWVHVGRVNSLRRLQAAASAGAHSVDGTFLKFGPDKNWPRLEQWFKVQKLNRPMVLA